MLYDTEKKEVYKKAFSASQKFLYSLSNNIPRIKEAKVDFNSVFEIFFYHNGRYSIYFYIDLIKFLDREQVDISVIIEVMKHAAVTSLFNQNSLYFVTESGVIIFTRDGKKIKKITAPTISEFLQESTSLKEFCCNYYGE
jgi:hypothetical protein